MKTILVPTDFSDASKKALEYAAALAKAIQAKLILYHAYHIPVPTTEMPVMIISPEELEKSNTERLESFRLDVLKQDNVPVENLISPGFAVDEICEIAVEKNVDLIVMGISSSSSLGHVLLGSVTTGVLQDTHKPLLIVPDNTTFSMPRKIAFACDYHNALGAGPVLELKRFVKLFNAELFVIHVAIPDEKIVANEAISGIRLENELDGIPHTLHFPSNPDIVNGLNEFQESHQIDLLVMVPKRHSLLSRIFHRSNTKRMAFHTHVPILALHE
jgi:nucleotide-binding universal stress UspA family protein